MYFTTHGLEINKPHSMKHYRSNAPAIPSPRHLKIHDQALQHPSPPSNLIHRPRLPRRMRHTNRIHLMCSRQRTLMLLYRRDSLLLLYRRNTLLGNRRSYLVRPVCSILILLLRHRRCIRRTIRLAILRRGRRWIRDWRHGILMDRSMRIIFLFLRVLARRRKVSVVSGLGAHWGRRRALLHWWLEL